MKLSISNIAWTEEYDDEMYGILECMDYQGIEVAPTRIMERPYERLKEASDWACGLQTTYGLEIPSMQSIWYGRQEGIFRSTADRQALLEYTKSAIDWAAATGCGNLVFGCPRNRAVPEGITTADVADIEREFFGELGDYAWSKGTVLAMEANPPIYNTNYVTDTLAAISLVRRIDSQGFMVNLDIGTMISNDEQASVLDGNVDIINHVHISEPGLAPIEERQLHRQVIERLKAGGYDGYLSIEMGKGQKPEDIKRIMDYVKSIA